MKHLHLLQVVSLLDIRRTANRMHARVHAVRELQDGAICTGLVVELGDLLKGATNKLSVIRLGGEKALRLGYAVTIDDTQGTALCLAMRKGHAA